MTGFALGPSAGGRVQLLKLGLKLLIDQQQRLQRTVDVAIAAGNNFVDRVIVCSESHRILQLHD